MNLAVAPSIVSQDQASLKILMVCARFLPLTGGTEMHVYEVSRRMAAQGHHVTVLTTDPEGGLPAFEAHDGVDIVRRPAWPRKRDLYFAPGVWREIMVRDWDILHVQGYHTFVAPLAMAAALRKGKPFVLTFHSGGHSSALRNLIRVPQTAMLRPLARRAARLIGVSQFEADHFSRLLRVPRTRFAVIGNGAELPPPSARKRNSSAPLIISVGRLEKYKGHHRVIEAFPLVRAKYPGAKLRVVGDGPFKSALLEQVARLGLQDCVKIGPIAADKRTAMADLFAEASLLALLSDYEAHPVAVMEAISLGTSVLTGDSSGFIELAERGIVRAISPQNSPHTIANAMMEAMESTPPQIDLDLSNWADCTRQLLEVYTGVVAERRRQ